MSKATEQEIWEKIQFRFMVTKTVYTCPQSAASLVRVNLSFLVAGRRDTEDTTSHNCMPSQGKDSIFPWVVIRKMMKQAKHIQMRTFVGRSIQASAARNRQRRSLLCQSMLCLMRSHELGTDFAISSISSLSSLFWSSLFWSSESCCAGFSFTLFRNPSPSNSSPSFGSSDHCQGQK